MGLDARTGLVHEEFGVVDVGMTGSGAPDRLERKDGGSDPDRRSPPDRRKPMAELPKTLLIKRYASRRLYNTESSDYVTLDDIARLIREGRDVQIVDLKSGDDLTKQYLLQIIADHESQGDSVLPVNVLTDLVRSCTTGVHSAVPQFLSASFEILRESQSRMMENFANPMSAVPGFEAITAQQEAFFKAMTGGWTGGNEAAGAPDSAAPLPDDGELGEIRRQLADLQSRLAKMGR